jgi:peroxiredoxin
LTDEAGKIPAYFDVVSFLSSGTKMLVSMPHADTPVCTGDHLPTLIRVVDRLRRQGITMALVTTNTRDTMHRWIRNALAITLPETERGECKTPYQIPDVDGDLGFAFGALVNKTGERGLGAIWPRGIWFFHNGVLIASEIELNAPVCTNTTPDTFLAKHKETLEKHGVKV